MVMMGLERRSYWVVSYLAHLSIALILVMLFWALGAILSIHWYAARDAVVRCCCVGLGVY